MDQQDEQEIETRLRAALMARSEQVTHQTLRPGVVPNGRTASVPAKVRRTWSFSWRGALMPGMVMAALVGGVFLGVKLPQHGGGSQTTANPAAGGSSTPSTQSTPRAAGTTPTPAPSPTATAKAPVTFGGVQFQPLNWTLSVLNETTACLLPPKADLDLGDSAVRLPCGPDALMITTGVAPGTWPVGTVQDKAGWWPVKNAPLSEIPCPQTKAAVTAAASVTASVPLRHDDHYPLAGTTEAVYQEWSVTCGSASPGFRPMLWELDGGKIAVTTLAVDARDDRDALSIVGSMRLVG